MLYIRGVEEDDEEGEMKDWNFVWGEVDGGVL